jgi:hypothetical protein
MNRAAKSAPYIPVANDDCLASPPAKRGSAGIPHGVGFDTEEAPQAFIHSVLDLIAAFCEKWWYEVFGRVYAQTNKYLDAVNEFGQRNVGPFAEDVDGAEVVSGPVLELEAQKVPVVRK